MSTQLNGSPGEHTTFVMLTHIEPGPDGEQGAAERLNRDVMQHVRTQCPNVRWHARYVLSGPFDYLDLFEAPGLDDANAVASLVRTYGRAAVQLFPAMPWRDFKSLIHALPAEAPATDMNGMGE